MAITGPGTLPAPVLQSFANRLLAVPTPNYIHKIAAMEDTLPRNEGNTKRYRRCNPLDSSPVPLDDIGTTPPSQSLSAIDIDAKIDYYGNWVEINEKSVIQNQEKFLNQASIRLGQSLRLTEDELTSRMLASTAAQINCVNGASADNPTEITRADLAIVVRTLIGNDAQKFLTTIEGQNKFGTAPVHSAFLALCHSDLLGDLEDIAKWIPVAEYPNQSKVLPSEWGSVEHTRFMISSVGSKSLTASNDSKIVYNVFIAAQESYACIDQDGYSTQFLYRPAIYTGPLAQNVQVGWKSAFVPQLLNDAWLYNLRCTLSA